MPTAGHLTHNGFAAVMCFMYINLDCCSPSCTIHIVWKVQHCSCFLLALMNDQIGYLSGALILLNVVAASGQKLQGDLCGAVSCCVV